VSTHVTAGLGPSRPFPGLRPYEFADHDYFFGRDDQILALYRLLDRGPFTAVVGSSGSGKSSLVAAGLLPEIMQERRGDDKQRWTCFQLHPGDAPLSRLASALAGPPPINGEDAEILHATRRDRLELALRQSSFGLVAALREITSITTPSVLIIVDQFEEIFRFADVTGAGSRDFRLLAARQDEASAFVQLLLEASRDSALAVHIMLTMRSDYIGECDRFPSLPEAVASSQFLVPVLTRDQREQAIRGPIQKAGAAIDDDLVQRLLNDSSNEPDQLPVLQHALMRLWEAAGRRQGVGAQSPDVRRLTEADYEAIGGFARARSVHADEVLAELPGLDLAVEQAFRALAELDKDGRAVRRALPFARLLAETGIGELELRQVVDRFRRDDCSFLVPPLQQPLDSGTVVDIGHEALIRNWERMSGGPSVAVVTRGRKDWLGAEAEDGTIYRALLSIAEGVSRGGRPTLPLDQVEARWSWWKERPRTEAWAARYGGEFQAVRELFTNSQAALDADRRRREQERLNALTLENQRQEADRAERRRLEEHAHQQELLALARARANWIIGAALCVAIILAGVAGWAWWTATQQRDEARATSIWSRLVLKDPRLSRDEIDAVWELALAPRSVKRVFVRQLGEKPSYLARFGQRPLPIINALGLQLPEEEKKALLHHELARLGDTRDPDLIGVPESALAATAPWFDQAQSDAALASLLEVADKATENEDWKALGGAITSFAPHITASMGLIAHRRIICLLAVCGG